MKIKIGEIVIDFESEFEIVYKRLIQFPISCEATQNQVILKKSLISINIGEYKLLINRPVEETDLYPIINNIISFCVNDNNNMYIHGVVVSKNGRGWLLLGDFGSGKTTFANQMKKKGYKINSADQTWVRNDKMFLGSAYSKVENTCTFIPQIDIEEKVLIEKILILKPSFDGSASVVQINNRKYYIKNIFKFCNWSYDMPLFTTDIRLYDCKETILSFLKDCKIPLYNIRGNYEEIMEVLNDRKKGV